METSKEKELSAVNLRMGTGKKDEKSISKGGSAVNLRLNTGKQDETDINERERER
jgi:hypothetical protein